MLKPYDFDKAHKAIHSRQVLTVKNGILIQLIKWLTTSVLATEPESYLAQDVQANRKSIQEKRTLKPPLAALN